jgi:hypothetical protein
MAKSQPRRAKRRKTAAKRGKARRKISARKASRRNAPKRKTAKKKTARGSGKRKRTTAEGMRRALKLKQAAEQREHELHPQPVHNWPAQIPQGVEPDHTPNNIREQGDIANIIQNTSTRRAG